ncbi:hypothetical protein FN976_13030 [Caenimonas sedimenti]|uniref:Uncharacterized protein n=1 Tax=Caenimonas sedimenti TaxID=2596921 RepID=A0A562ZRA0_9BURK|nr:hypothetical protein [Caenimonas sedimenti]TWO70881.1 hypothetical protein FN976_13030 [Caenimonas sedimenti]
MDLRLSLLDSFQATGSDGASYKVRAYDRLAPDPSLGGEHWESTGEIEYRLDDGRRLEVERGGKARIVGGNVELTLPRAAAV